MHSTFSVIGTIATEPRLVNTQTGNQLCSFRIASDERRYDKQQQAWVESGTSWFTVVAFRTLASHASQSLHIGDRVIISGKLHVKNWEQAERKGTTVEIEADGIGHDLRWGISRFEKLSVQNEKLSTQFSGFSMETSQEAETNELTKTDKNVSVSFIPNAKPGSPFGAPTLSA